MGVLEILEIIIKLFIAGSIVNVWVFNKDDVSRWRGGNADTLEDEFGLYGLSKTTMYIVGTIKVLLAALLIMSILLPIVEWPAAIGMGIMMLGAIYMHISVGDDFIKSAPAGLFLILCFVIIAIPSPADIVDVLL
ncbi:DoxX family protein [Nonlabens xiamenensis]|uniref:DoxX family protein n=1 Tax=Nonlabens xiamenensis TaxID=2341043 RepID=UPI000F605A28|nr:DoxX family protein [Nonlabens xiamenensis]